ncbi:MerR family transcriptional regulator [Prochlorothrix hollandica]|uniref:MerR family transcriptional regulator n=1 Tax=Prochlorothrix hollandica TaxID=1223 RepID=UPI000349ECAC|nr:MerR family transcriptional regulator [Prochlorothrix hollandica]
MRTLQQLAQENPHWSLDQLVKILNALLPNFLPDRPSTDRPSTDSPSLGSKTLGSKTPHGVRDGITPRLVRHYTTQGLVDEPLKDGRSARYTYRHLLQLLVVRRLLREGYGTSVLQPLLAQKTTAELEALLQGGVQLTVTPANPALSFLEDIRQRSRQIAPPPGTTPALPTPATFQPLGPIDPSYDLDLLDPGDFDSLDALDLDDQGLADFEDLTPDSLADAGDRSAEPLPWETSLDPLTTNPTPRDDAASHWTRLEVLPGLEVSLRRGVTLPRSPQERQNLAAAIVAILDRLDPL